MSEKLYTIGEVVKITGFTYRTIRYYGELGIVEPTWSEDGRKRCYTKDDINHFLFTKRLKDLGFPLEKVKSVIEHKRMLENKPKPKDIAPYMSEILEEQYNIAKEKAEKFTKLANLLEKMVFMSRNECSKCERENCKGKCYAEKFLETEELFEGE